MNANLNVILGVELICAAQGIGFRAPLSTSPQLQAVIATARTMIAPLKEDRYMASDLDSAAKFVRDGQLLIGLDLPDYILGQSPSGMTC